MKALKEMIVLNRERQQRLEGLEYSVLISAVGARTTQQTS